ncbi:unnamed protein product [Trichogramma brassicae]|uniref:Uncharacterized protein n=1 Tax=Trichogramma brassicae TaxID=86971 RepID=A0A6H5IDH9_9HYME|nr:unnamed protein product [Trichogramma brassicae]
MIFIMTRSMTRTSDWRRHDARRLVEVEARCCASCCCTPAAAAAQHQVSTSSSQRFKRFKRRAAGASCEWFRSGLLLPSNAYGLVRKTPSVVGCAGLTVRVRGERPWHVGASNAYGLVLFVRRALTGGVGCEDTDRRSSSAT